MTFAERFTALARERSCFCLGIDPSIALLERWGLTPDAEGVEQMCDLLLEAAGDSLACVKPQMGFFERFGSAGVAVLERLIKRVRERGTLVIVDAKRNDIGSTVDAYARAYFGELAPMQTDALTANAYLGLASLLPMFEEAAASGGAVFVVVRSSNQEGTSLQQARNREGAMVAEALADEITALNERLAGGPLGPVGAVVGATLGDEGARLAARLERSLLLAPGVGAQGATFDDAAASLGGAATRTILPISRGVLVEGPDVDRLRDVLQRHRESALRFAS